MTQNSAEIYGQPHAEIGRLIEQGAETVVERWRQRAMNERTVAQSAHRDVLLNALPEFLRALGRDMAASRPGGPVGSMLLAVEHGEQRWQNGWQLSEVVRDYQLLRLVMVEWLAEQMPRDVHLRETLAVGMALDDAIAAAVTMYVGNQEESQREGQALLTSAKESAEAANLAKERFLADISHELRNPLSSILGMTQLALGEEKLTPEMTDYLSTIKDSADVLLTLLNEILDYSRLASGPLELDPHPFSLRTLIDDTLRSFALRADEKRLELVQDIPADVPDRVVGDSMRVRQILTNLVSNAVKFTSEGEVVLAVQTLERQERAATLQFTISDTGIGIAPEAQQAIFRPYTQANASTARQYGGTGLGLAISKELTSLMNGALSLESEVGRGSRFHFQVTLPVAQDVTAAPPPGLARLRGIPALVVEDNAATRGIVKRALEEWELAPAAVGDAATAEAAMQAASAAGKPFRLLIVDAVLPGDSGFTFVERVRARGGEQPRVVMLFTNVDRSEAAAIAERLGVQANVIKPVSAGDLMETVLDAFELNVPHDHDVLSPIPAAARPLRVLVAEDTPANQKTMRLLLAKQGHQATIVDHGKAAVDRLRKERFDVVLMDLQMPVMDGLKATSLIRAAERPERGRTPIVALTAHAMPSHEQRCLEAGMDAYLSKPIDARELAKVLAELTGQKTSGASDAAASASKLAAAGQTAVINRQRALERLGGNEELFDDLAGFFLEDAPDLMRRIREGLQAGDGAATERAAHSLKGLAANFDAAATTAAALAIEQLAGAGKLNEAGPLVERCQAELDRLTKALQPFRR